MMDQRQGACSEPSWNREARSELVDGQMAGVKSCRTSMGAYLERTLRLPKHPVTAWAFLGQQTHESWAIGRVLERLVNSAYGHNDSEWIIVVRTSDLEIGVSQVKRRTGGRLNSRK